MTIDLDIYLEWNTTPEPEPPPSVKYDGWRVLHKIEGGNDATPPVMPEVTPPLNYIQLPMTKEIQKLSYDLMIAFNPTITPKQWRRIHGTDRAFNNRTGFNKLDDPRADFINERDINAPLPTYDKAQRLCGGQFVRGDVVGDKLICRPDIHGIDANLPMPTVDTVIANNWYLLAVNVNENFTVISDWAQGNGGVVAIPFIFSRDVIFPLAYFQRWQADELPDHLKIYL